MILANRHGRYSELRGSNVVATLKFFSPSHARLFSVGEFDSSGLKRVHNGVHGLHIGRHGSLGPLQTLYCFDGYIGPPSKIGLLDSSHRACSAELLSGDDQDCTYRPFGKLIVDYL